MASVLSMRAAGFQRWLFDHALPLWWEVGADHQAGGFHERLDQTGRPIPEPRRIRVQARQVFVYAEAGRLGWAGPWEAAIRHGLDSLERFYRRPDGLYRTSVAPDGRVHDDSVDLYDQAFVLLALAHAHARLGEPDGLKAQAEGLLERLVAGLAHPLGGFEEASPRRLPLRSNPHMHLLEALLAWVSGGANGLFRERATDIVHLACTRLIDPVTGSIGEYYQGDWAPVAGQDGHLREPGHQFEWAFLLREARDCLGYDSGNLAERLAAFGESRGIGANRAAVFSIDDGGAVIDATARLWAQTERLRTSLVFDAAPAALEAADVIGRFLDTPVPGLWLDRMMPDGTLVPAPAPASTLYHLMTAFSVLFERTGCRVS